MIFIHKLFWPISQTKGRDTVSSFTRCIGWALTIWGVFFSSQTLSQQVTLASSISIPPYVIVESDTGIQLDIVRESLARSGHTLKVLYASNKRALSFLKTKNVDGMINVPSGTPGLYYSDSTIEYQNGIIALESRNLAIVEIQDLRDLRVVGFQNASNYFGSEFKAMTEQNQSYDEVVNQLAQLNMLFKQRCDAIVMDKRIFNYYHNTYMDELGFDKSTRFYNILPPSPRYVAFHDESLRDRFNAGLKELKASGRYQEIVNSYLNEAVFK